MADLLRLEPWHHISQASPREAASRSADRIRRMRVQRAKSLTERAAGARLRAGVAALLLITAVAAARGQDSQALFAIRPPGTIFILYHPDECRVSFGYPTAD